MKNRNLTSTSDIISKKGAFRKITLLSTALVSIPAAIMMFPTSAFAECVETVPGLFICAADDVNGITVTDEQVVSILPGVKVDNNAGGDIIVVGENGRVTIDGGLVGTAENEVPSANALVMGANSSVEIVQTAPATSVVRGTTNAISFAAPSEGFNGTASNSVTNEGMIFGNIISNGDQTDSVTNRTGAFITGNMSLADGANTTTNSGTITGNITGGTGNDAVVNSAGATLTGNVSLGDGDNGVVNAGALTGNVTTGSGTDTYTNSASGTQTGSVALGDGDNTASIAGTLTGNLTTAGGDDSVSVAAGGTVGGNVNMGDGTNSGSVAGTVTGAFNGGAGDDTVAIAAGGSVGAGLNFGDGTNSLNNSGDVTGDITMGSGDDTIVTNGTITGNIAMGAGTNAITFNADSALPTGTLTADADGDNSLNLGGTGADTFNISVTNFDRMNKDAAGTWTLDTFDNSFAEGININAGKLVANGADRFGANIIVNNAMAEINEADAGTYSGNMSGTGSLEKTGSGTTTLSGSNSFTGGTIVTDGELSVTGNNALADDGAVTIGLEGTLVVTEAETIGSLISDSGGDLHLMETLTTGGLNADNNFYGNASGAGGLTKVGTGTLTLGGENGYTGTTTINSGTIRVMGRMAIDDAGAVSVGDDGTFNVGANETIGSLAGTGSVIIGYERIFSTGAANTSTTYSGVISGDGTLEKVGTGNFTITGVNTYTGGTTVTAGTLTGTTTSLQGNIADNATLAFDQETDGTYAGMVSGTGSLTKLGTGRVMLTGANTYTGGTTVTAGTLAGTTTSLQGDVANNATLAFDQETDGTYAGVVSGTGVLLKEGTGNVTLSGENAYSGGTIVSAGTLTGNTSSLQGAIANNATVDFAQSSGGTYAGAMSGTGVMVKSGEGNLTLSGENSYSGGTTVSEGTLTGTTTSVQGDIANSAAVAFDQESDGTYAGVMSGSGTLTKLGEGNVTLGGANTYSGGTTVTAGTLTGTTASLQGGITDNAALAFDQETDGTYAGVVSGTGSLTKLGTGRVMLTGENTYSGGTTVTAGTLAGTTTSLQQANITNNATLSFDQETDGSYAGVVSGTGVLMKEGTGNVTLTGMNIYSGGTTLNAGTLSVSSAGRLGDAEGGLTFGGGTLNITDEDTSARAINLMAGGGTVNADVDITLSGVISGAGGLTKTGTGITTLTGTNTYSGGTTVSGGTLTGSAASVQGNIANNAAVNFIAAADEMYVGDMSGTGSMTKTGEGNLTMTGTNSYAGGTTVTAGTLTGDSDSLQGDIVNDAALVFDQAGAGTYGGALTGTGSLTKSGAGNLTTTGAISQDGGTTVSAGVLSVNGTLVSDVALTGGTLGGTGTVTGDITSTGATIGAGNSIGTLNINGDLTLDANSTMEVELSSNGAALSGDLVAVTGSTTLAGTVTFVSAKGLYQNGNVHDFVTSGAGGSGAFATVNGTSVNNFITLSVSNPADGDARVAVSRKNYASAASGSNQTVIAGALDSGVGSATGDFANALIELDYVGSDADAQAAFNQMSPEPYSSFIIASQQAGDAFSNKIMDRMHASDGGKESSGIWIQGFGSWNSLDNDNGYMGYNVNLYGVAAGVEGSFGENMLGGLAVGYSSSDINTDALGRTGKMDSYQFGAYVGGKADSINYMFSGFYGNNSGEMTRSVSYNGLSKTALGKTDGNEYRLTGRISMNLGNDNSGFKPYVGVEYSGIKLDAFNETGAGGLSLNVKEMNGDRFLGELGLSYAGNMEGFRPTAHLAYRYAFSEDLPEVGASFAGGGNSFTVRGQERGRGSVVFGAGLVGNVSDSVTIFVNYNGEISSSISSHVGSAGLRFSF